MYKAILVDDEPLILERLKTLVDWESFGFQLSACASNGEDCYRLALEIHPNLIVTDIRMAGFDGITMIKKITPELPNCKYIILSGYSEFGYAQDAMQYGVTCYLLKPVKQQELESAVSRVYSVLSSLEKQENLIKEGSIAMERQVAMELFSGKMDANLKNQARYAGIYLDAKSFWALLAEEDHFAEKDAAAMEPFSTVQDEDIRKLINEVLSISEKGCFYYDENGRYIFLMFSQEKITVTSAAAFAEKLRLGLADLFRSEITVGYSTPVYNFKEIAAAYQEAVSCIDGKFIIGKGRSIGTNSFPHRDNFSDFSVKQVTSRERILEAIQQADEKELSVEIHNFFFILRSCCYFPEISRGIIASNFMLILHQTIVKSKADVAQIVGESFQIDAWVKKNTLDELEMQFCYFCIKILQYYSSMRSHRSAKVCDEVAYYVKEKYAEEISLKKVARKFYLNPVYLGQLFKKETGQVFNDYLTAVRIDKAKHLLLVTDQTVNSIAQTVGYKDARNFYLAFKKQTGCTPNFFRQKRINNQFFKKYMEGSTYGTI